MIRLIAFDLGNLLFRVDHTTAWARIRPHTALAEKTLFERFYGSGELIENLIGRLSDEAFFQRLRDTLEVQLDPKELQEIWTSVFFPIEDRIATVLELGDRYRLGVISNISHFHSAHLEQDFPVMEALPEKVYSWACGHVKPRSEPFRAMLSRTGCKPAECLFLDDQKRHIEAARALGWHARSVALSDDLGAILKALPPSSTNARI